MRWRVYRFRQWLRAWIGAAPADDFEAVARRVRDLHWDSRTWKRAMDEQLNLIADNVSILQGQMRMLALKDAKSSVEKADAAHGA